MLKESEPGVKADDICRRHGISTAAFSAWRKQYGGMDGETLSAIGPRTMKAVTGHSGVEMLREYGHQIRQRELATRAQDARNRFEQNRKKT